MKKDAATIEEFAKWCYENGIDFSYMRKGTDKDSFATTIINRFNEELKTKASNEINKRKTEE